MLRLSSMPYSNTDDLLHPAHVLSVAPTPSESRALYLCMVGEVAHSFTMLESKVVASCTAIGWPLIVTRRS